MIIWAARFPKDNAAEARAMWDIDDVEVCVQADSVWLRGTRDDERLHAILRAFWEGQRFHVLPDGQLRSPHELVPRGHLPDGPWVKLHDWMTVTLSVTADPAKFEGMPTLRLVPTTLEQVPTALLTTLDIWRNAIETLAEFRCKGLSFAVSVQRQVLVVGTPLPGIAGVQLVENEQICIPAGMTWSPSVKPSVLKQVLGAQSSDWILGTLAGQWELISAESFVVVTRHSVRTTFQKMDIAKHDRGL